MEVAHGNGIRVDCRLENLTYKTPQGNWEDRYIHGTDCSGEKHGNAKLSNLQVQAIRREYSSGEQSLRGLGRKYSISPRSVKRIVLFQQRARS
jgi:hypothetical protein